MWLITILLVILIALVLIVIMDTAMKLALMITTLYNYETKKLNIQDNVIFTGKVPYNDVPKYYNLGDVFVNASLTIKNLQLEYSLNIEGITFIITSILFSVATLPRKSITFSSGFIPNDIFNLFFSSKVKLDFANGFMSMPVGITYIGLFFTLHLYFKYLAVLFEGVITHSAFLKNPLENFLTNLFK